MSTPIKILHVINSLALGGAEKMVADMLPLLNESGATAHVLLLQNTPSPLSDALRDRGVTVISHGNSGIYHPIHAWRIFRLARAYDVVHVHLFPSLYWAALARFLGAKARFVYTEHSTHNKRRGHFLFKHLDRWAYRRFDKIVCISEKVQQALMPQARLPESAYTVISNGIDLQALAAAEPYAKTEFFPNPGLMLLQVSSFRYPKDQITLIRALALLPSNVNLMLVGEGPMQPECRREVATFNLTGRVFFAGNRNDVPRLLKTADVVVLSTHYEGVSLSSIEGMASGKPFVAAKAPGLADTVSGAALLFPPGNAQLLAVALEKLWSDPLLYTQTVAACEQRAKQYDLRQTVREHLQLYAGL